MPDSMVERVARALLWANMIDVGFSDAEARWSAYEHPGEDWKEWAVYARVAIETMREPSGRMRAAGRDAIEPFLPDGRVAKPLRHQWQIADDTWQAMIDAALPEDAAHG